MRVLPFYCDYGSNILVGDNIYVNHNLIILDGARVPIGKNVFVAPNIYTAGHQSRERRAEIRTSRYHRKQRMDRRKCGYFARRVHWG